MARALDSRSMALAMCMIASAVLALADLGACFCRDAQFRVKFRASIVSIRRKGHKLDSKLGDVALQAADEIVFDCGDEFDEASEIVQRNLCDVDVVESGGEREFMFAFEVLGPASPPAQLSVAAASQLFTHATDDAAICRSRCCGPMLQTYHDHCNRRRVVSRHPDPHIRLILSARQQN